MGQGDPGRRHQAAGMKSPLKIGKTFHNVSFDEFGFGASFATIGPSQEIGPSGVTPNPAANSWRTPPSRPRVSPRSRASACGPVAARRRRTACAVGFDEQMFGGK
jgi:hypothetical protein